jgi:DNA polymerase-3 subunit delta'
MQFSQIYGVNHIKEKLIQSVSNNHVAHAQMFVGLEGSANLAMALAFSTFLNCENKLKDDSCGVCASCSKMKKMVHPDVHFVYPMPSLGTGDKDKLRNDNLAKFREFILDNPYGHLIDWAHFVKAENKQLNISVDESRKIIGNISMKAFEGEFKIVFIWKPEQMNVASANAILKALEEPPEKTMFFLVTGDLEKNIQTIRSRTQAVIIPNFSEEEIEATLTAKFMVEPFKAKKASNLAEGNLNHALKLSQEIKDDSFPMFQDWLRACYKLDFTSLISFADDFQKLPKASQKQFFQFGMSVVRSVLLIHSGGQELLKIDDEEIKFVTNLATVLPLEKLEGIERAMNTAFYHLERNASPKIESLHSAFEVIKILRKQ